MRKLLLLLALTLPITTFATCTWTQTTGLTEGTVVCTTANEALRSTTVLTTPMPRLIAASPSANASGNRPR